MKEQAEKLLEEVRDPYLRLKSLQYFGGEGSEGGSGDGQTSDDGGNTNDQEEYKDGDTGASNDGTKSNTSTSEGDTKPEKTFSQRQVSAIAAREKKQAMENMLKELGVEDVKSAKEGLEQFKKMRDEQMTEQEKLKQKAEELEGTNGKLLTRAETAEAKLSAFSHGAKADSVDDVIVLAKNLVNDETDMDAAIQKVLEKYPHFKQEQTETNQEGTKKKPKFSEGDHKQDGKPSQDEMWQNAFTFQS